MTKRVVKIEVPQEAKHAIKRAKFDADKHEVHFVYRAPYARESYPTRKYAVHALDAEDARKRLITFASFDIAKYSFAKYFKRVYVKHYVLAVKHAWFIHKLHVRQWHAKKAGVLESLCSVTNYCSDRRQEYKQKGLYACADCPLKAQCSRMKYFGEKNKPIITHGPLIEDEAFIESHRYEYGLGDGY